MLRLASVAAEEHSGSVKRNLRSGLAWKKRGNGPVAGASDAKTYVSRFGDHSGALPVQRGRNPYFLPQRSPSAINRKTHIEKNRGGKAKRGQPLNSQLLAVQPRTTRLFARAASCAPKHQKPTKRNERAWRGSKPQPSMCVNISVPPATALLQVDSSWPDQKMGSFGFFCT